MNRAERRRKHQIKGWIEHPSPKQLKRGSGWFGEFSKVYRRADNQYVIMIRELITEWGRIHHMSISTQDGHDVPWAEKQQIKNEIFGEEAQALEVFPKTSELVDAADMYHLWILPNDFKLPFTLKGD